ncbi:hypothetical protein SLS58_001541 [Diplodia intermedia]|uniref:BHLH domain-containing protein n=1 Tax=Diplodia intermedia TaxID=856260 RepID=A0ABR3U1E7_9PEZI
MPAHDDAAGKAHELPASQSERRKLLENERQKLRQDIVNRASHAGQLCNTVENQGKTVSSIPKDSIRPFVRALRQLAKLNRLINECEKDKSLLMGDIMSWREDYRDTNAQDLLGMNPPRLTKNIRANVP